ncbi:MAG: oligosaccharide flippase family protein [Bryobacteraceae bacterium]
MNDTEGEQPTNRRNSALGILTSNAIATFVVSVQALVLMPFYLRFVEPKTYGAWIASGDLFFYLNALEFGIPNLMIQQIGASVARRDLPTAGRCTASGLAILSGAATLLLVLCSNLADRVPGWFHVVGDDAVILARCFLFGGIAASLSLINQAFVALGRGLQDTRYQNVSAVVSSLLGFGAAFVSILHGAGLYSIPVSLMVRALCSAAFSFTFWFRRVPVLVRSNFVPDRRTLKAFLQLSPLTALGSFSYTTTTQSENLLVGLIVGTDAAIILSLTRRGAEVLRSLIDMIIHASFGAFSHLVVSPEKHRAVAVFDELTGLRLSVAVIAAAGFMALNEMFVRTWVGSSYYGGWTVTALIALNLLFSGQSYLVNSLYRATGHIINGSLLLIGEALFRLPMAAAGTALFGLAGLQAAAVLTSIGSLAAGRLFCRRAWQKLKIESSKKRGPCFVPHASVFALGLACCVVAGRGEGGLGISILTRTLLLMACIYLVYTDPFLRDVLASLAPRMRMRLRIL